MALERLQALALFWVPQDNTAALPAARENLAVERKGDRPDSIAAIFSNVREHVMVVYASPPLSGGGACVGGEKRRHNRYFNGFVSSSVPVALNWAI